ncbi:hypothetical protein P1P75_07050 [Streptomyces sp. ID05-39B]|uniref:hypothetical protein n=1 Tax=Streptomyces sp. ID05-39B TaxID=3028664 RepID=UPI0029B9C829|nr:hypothetical protein [Streptomyces sp. ID05-39B]MDX3526198.1 hypothetical protein [Streptomyces sp. ID05-39B]
MPAVDSPAPRPLPRRTRRRAAAVGDTAHCAGLNVTIYDPDPDPDRTAGALLSDPVVAALGRS